MRSDALFCCASEDSYSVLICYIAIVSWNTHNEIIAIKYDCQNILKIQKTGLILQTRGLARQTGVVENR